MKKRYVCTLCAGHGEVIEYIAEENEQETPEIKQKKVPCPLCVERNLQPFIEIEY
jgi:hypothetical protein